MKQRSKEWWKAREAYFTASRALTIATNGTGLRNYVIELLEEKYLGIKKDFSNYWTRRGIELEQEAINMFMLETGIKVDKCGFLTNKKYPQAGASPDGLIKRNAVLEVKCPSDKIFSKQLLKEEIPTMYYYQIQMQLMITGR